MLVIPFSMILHTGWYVLLMPLLDPCLMTPLRQSSCDEFPMNSVLEGGAANGAVTKAVPVAEQGFQGTLHARLSQLLVKENNGQTIWSHPARVGSKFPGMCHQFILSLQDTRPAGSDSTAVGELHTGGAFLKGEAAGFVEIVKNRLAKPPPSPLDDAADYLDSDTALHPPGNYQAWDCSPEDTTDCSEEESTLTSLFKRKMRKRALNRKSPTKRQEQCTTSPAPPTDTASAMADATSRASVASTAAASATAGACDTTYHPDVDGLTLLPFHSGCSRKLSQLALRPGCGSCCGRGCCHIRSSSRFYYGEHSLGPYFNRSPFC